MKMKNQTNATEKSLGWGEEALYLYERPYPTINGEGNFIGQSCIFVRFQGCNVGCSWCDAMSTWPGKKGSKPLGTRYTFEDLEQIFMKEFWNVDRIWWPGGAPTEFSKDILHFIEWFEKRNPNHKKIWHMITAGEEVYVPLLDKLDFITIDLKPPASRAFKGDQTIQNEFIGACIENETLRNKIEFKMAVAKTKEDITYALNQIKFFDPINVTIQPVMWSEAEVKKNKQYAETLKDYSLYLEKFQQPAHETGELPTGWVSYQEFAETFLNSVHTNNCRVLCQLHKIYWPGEMDGI